MKISASVGDWEKKAINNPGDVKIIQSLLKQLSILTKKRAFDPKWIDGIIAKPPKESSTVRAIIAFQSTFMHMPDGLIEPGKTTVQKLRSALARNQFPKKPDFTYLTTAGKNRLFGEFDWEPQKRPDGSIRAGTQVILKDDWQKSNIISVTIPGLNKIPLYSTSNNQFASRMRFHKTVANQLLSIWRAWDHAGLIDRVQTYDGAYNPRLSRNSTTQLSSHAWGTAFDINQKTNALGKIPAMLEDNGCVRELVQIANAFGFYWGGHWDKPDGMHFEAAIIGACPSPV